MKIKPNPALLGAFILGAAALAVAALFLLGGRHLLTRQRRLVVFFEGSVAGLERGSAVKLRGVRAGRVVGVRALISPDLRSTVVAVVCDVGEAVLRTPEGDRVDFTDSARLKALIDEGLRARLEPAGLSGDYVVELDLLDPKRYPATDPPEWARKAEPYPSVPQAPSTTEELIGDLRAAARQLRQADLGALSKSVSGPELKRALQQLGDAASSVKDLADFLERNPNAVITGKKGPGK